MSKTNEADELFRRLDYRLGESIDQQYFCEPREFRSLIQVLAVVGPKAEQIINSPEDETKDLLSVLKDRNPAYNKLLNQRKIVEEVIEDVVKFQHGGLNNSVDTMSEVVREYSKGRDNIRGLRKSLAETKSVLTARKSGQVSMKELWLKKVELQETLRMVKELEDLRSTPHKVQRYMDQKRYLTAVLSLTKAVSSMFSEDLVGVGGLSAVREQLLELKEQMLETLVAELREAIIGSTTDQHLHQHLMRNGYDSNSDEEDSDIEDVRSRTDSVRSGVSGVNKRNFPTTLPTRSIGGKSANGDGASTVGGGSTFSGGMPLDFHGVDEAVEASLHDPGAAGGLYIRLLVKTVGVLELEEDVERMILDSIAQSFRIGSIRRLREAASAHLAKALQKAKTRNNNNIAGLANGNRNSQVNNAGSLSTEQELSVHSKLFAAFVGSLLDSSLMTLRRLFYVLKLLSICKSLRVQAAAAQSSNMSVSSAGSSTVRSGGSKSISSTLATGAPSPWSKQAVGIGGASSTNHSIKDSHKKIITRLWCDMQHAIVQQICAHLVEPEVQDITDQVTSSISRQNSFRIDSTNNSPMNSPTIGRLTRRVSGFNAGSLDTNDGLEEGGSTNEIALLFKPSVRHAAPLYRRIVIHNSLIYKLLTDNEVEDITSCAVPPPGSKLAVLHGAKDDDSDSTDGWKTLKSRSARQLKDNPGDEPSKGTPLLEVIQNCLENDLIPIIQSNVNHVMRDIQLNNQYFSVSHTADDTLLELPRNSVASVIKGVSQRGSSHENDIYSPFEVTTDQPPLCQAAELCLNTSKPLFGYWLQLSEHRSMVSTVLDRLITGFGSAAREELSSSSYLLLTTNNSMSVLPAITKALKSDLFFESYRNDIYGVGKVSVEELFTHSYNNNRSIGRPTRGNSHTNVTSREELKRMQYIEEEMSSWGRYWYVGDENYPASSQTIVKDFDVIATIASIAYGCDWIAKRISGFTSITLKKVGNISSSSNASNSSNGKDSGHVGHGGSKISTTNTNILKNSSTRQELQESKTLLTNTVTMGARQLARIAEEGLAILRGELQIICFYFLYRLAHIEYIQPNTLSTGNNSNSSSSNLHHTASSFSMAGGSYVSNNNAGLDTLQSIGTAEEEAILGTFSSHLSAFFEAVLRAASSSTLAVVFSPICTLIPRALIRCAMYMATNPHKSKGSLAQLPPKHQKAHLLRIVVIIQQSITLHIQALPFGLESRRQLFDKLTEGFEYSRRFITLFGMPSAELKAYLLKNPTEYKEDEVEVLWQMSPDTDESFRSLWKQIDSNIKK